MNRRTVYADIESGGLEEARPLTQISAVAIDDETWAELEVFDRKLGFNVADADPEALRLNHFDPAVWAAEAVSPLQAANEFAAFVKRHQTLRLISKRGNPYPAARMCAHNAQFDGPRLRRLFDQHGIFPPWDMRVRCTVQRALWYFDECPDVKRPKDMKLSTLAEYFGIPITETHEALADVRLTIALARKLAEAAWRTAA